jgi:hypothetical protein
LTKASDDPPNCAAQFPDETTDSIEVIHNPDTGEVTVITSQGEFQGTLDEEYCSQDTGCYTEEQYCANGCTSTLEVCFIESNPTLIQGSMTTAIHLEDGGPCLGPLFCTVVYNIDGQRVGRAESPVAATDSLSATPVGTRDKSVTWKALEAVLAGARAILERILPGF